MKKTIYIQTYSDLRNEVIQHLISGDYRLPEKRIALGKKFYDAEKVTMNIEEQELHQYLQGCGDPIYYDDYLYGDNYIEFLEDIIIAFNTVLPDQIDIPKLPH